MNPAPERKSARHAKCYVYTFFRQFESQSIEGFMIAIQTSNGILLTLRRVSV